MKNNKIDKFYQCVEDRFRENRVFDFREVLGRIKCLFLKKI